MQRPVRFRAPDYTPPGTDVRIPTLGTLPLLYDVRSDPSEAYDVVDSHPEVAARLHTRLEAWRVDFIADPRAR